MAALKKRSRLQGDAMTPPSGSVAVKRLLANKDPEKTTRF
jgi:hypothetical protein